MINETLDLGLAIYDLVCKFKVLFMVSKMFQIKNSLDLGLDQN